jgi:HSP20 family protein
MSFSKFGHGDEMREWVRHMRNMMDEMKQRSFVQFRDEDTWQPATDVYETETAYCICVDLAGMTPEQVEVSCEDQHRVRISGFRPNPRPCNIEGSLTLHIMEIDHGPFRREVTLPEPINMDSVEATYDKGFLWVMLPKIATP